MRVLIADDRANVRSALRLILSQDDEMQVVGEVAGIEQLVTAIRATQPDVLLLEWELLSSESALKIAELKKDFPQVEIIAMSGRPELRKAAAAAGVDVFISKVDPPERLVSQLHSVGSAGQLDDPADEGQPGSNRRQEE